MLQLNKKEIIAMIKIDDPVLLLDSMDIIDDEQEYIGYARKSLSGDEFFWKVHMIGDNVMPGTYMLESMTQAATVLVMVKEQLSYTPRLVKIDGVRFFNEIRPGGNVTIHAKIKSIRHSLMQCTVSLFNGDIECCRAELTSMKKMKMNTEK